MRSFIIALSLVAFSAGALAADECKEGEALDKDGKCAPVMVDEKK